MILALPPVSNAVKCVIYEICLRVRNSDLSFWLHYFSIRTIIHLFLCSLGPVGSTGAIGPQGPPGPKGEKGKGLSGVKYVRWGKTNCSGDATTVYSGKGGQLHI